ncbi:GNAT family N-acetyltransferase [Sorangium sp. So ce1151]|uniref:GNAT family N-acetyltransferase n=1 Tax=Sorangium sp. So ce1151 TaxID=3133332 RepID=UPI003F63C825
MRNRLNDPASKQAETHPDDQRTGRTQNVKIELLSKDDFDEILPLAQELNPNIEPHLIAQRLRDMLNSSNYLCFGGYVDDELVGVCGAWMSVRLYSGKQIELDNGIVKPGLRSQGFGNAFLEFIQKWAVENDCSSIELNCYVTNSSAHKFYFTNGMKIIAFHFQKAVQSS